MIMKLRFLLAIWLMIGMAVCVNAATPAYTISDLSIMPSNLLRSNILDSASVVWNKDQLGRMTANASAGLTNFIIASELWTNVSEVLTPTVFSRPVNGSNFWVNGSPALAPNDSGVNLVAGHTDWRALHFQILNNHELRFTNVNATRARLLPDTDGEIELGNTDMRFDGIYTTVIDSRTASDLDLFSDQSIFLNIGSAAYRFTSTAAQPSPTLTLDLGLASAQWNGVYASNYTAGGGITNNGTYQHSVGAFTGALFVSSNANGVAYWSTNVNNIGVTNLSVYNNVIFNGSIISNFNRDILWTNDTAVTKGSLTGLSPRFALRWGSLGSDYVDAWNTTNVGFWSVAMGSNIIARAPGSVVFGVDNEVRTNAINSVISGGRLNFIGTNSFNSVIAGGYSNIVNGLGTSNSVISGGIQNLIQNVNGAALGFGVVGGGFDNRASTNYAGIFSGQSQRVNGSHSAVLGGAGNTIDILVAYGGIVGGQNNTLNGAHGFIGGGRANGIGSSSATAANFGFVGGGLENTIGPIGSGNVTNAVIVGGRSHIIGEQADNAVIVGGEDHEIRQATNAFIGGGGGNTIIGTSGKARYSIIPGGGNNTMSGFTDFSFILGSSNLIATNWTGIIGWKATNNTTPYAITIAPQGETSKTIYTSSNLTVRTSFATVPDTVVTLAADNQVVNVTTTSYVQLASDSAVAGDRTFLLTGTNVTSGAHAILEWTGTNAGELVDDAANSGAGNVRLSATWTPTQYDTLSLIFNGTDWIETARATN